MAEWAENEMKADCAMPERVGSNEGLGRSRGLKGWRPVTALIGREDTRMNVPMFAALCAAREPDCSRARSASVCGVKGPLIWKTPSHVEVPQFLAVAKLCFALFEHATL